MPNENLSPDSKLRYYDVAAGMLLAHCNMFSKVPDFEHASCHAITPADCYAKRFPYRRYPKKDLKEILARKIKERVEESGECVISTACEIYHGRDKLLASALEEAKANFPFQCGYTWRISTDRIERTVAGKEEYEVTYDNSAAEKN